MERLGTVTAVALAFLVAGAFAEYAAGRDPLFCNYLAGTPEETSCLSRRQFWLGALGLLGLVFTVYYTGEAARAASESAKVAEQSLRETQRAFISVEPLGLLNFGSSDRHFNGHVSIENLGNLPAKDLSWWIGMEVDNAPHRREFSMPDTLRGNHVVAPKS